MKRITALVLVLSMFLATGICGAAYASEDDDGLWVIKNYVDDFGDEEDEQYIGTVSIGEFSNTATSSSKLIVHTIMDYNKPKEAFVRFKLLEYGDAPAVYYDNDDIVLRVKAGDSELKETLKGNSPNGDVYMLNINSSILFGELFKELLIGNDVRCIIDVGNSRYKFTLSADGFRKIADKLVIDNTRENGSTTAYTFLNTGLFFYNYQVGIMNNCYAGTDVETYNTYIGTRASQLGIDEEGYRIWNRYWNFDELDKETVNGHIKEYGDYLEGLGYNNVSEDEDKAVYNIGDWTVTISSQVVKDNTIYEVVDGEEQITKGDEEYDRYVAFVEMVE